MSTTHFGDLVVLGAWRRALVALGAAMALVAFAHWGAWVDMIGLWTRSSTFNHCFLIPPLALFLVWERRAEIARLTPEASPWGIGYVAVNALVWFAGDLTGIAFFAHLAAVGTLVGIVWAVLGDAVTRVIRFPLFYLYFCVPEGEFLVPYLQDLTAFLSVAMLRLSGVPVYLEGWYILIPGGAFVVAEVCSGINYLIASLAVGTLFAYRAYHTWPRRLAFMVLAVIVPLVANGMRAYGIIMIAHLSNFKYAVGVDHLIYGWIFFGFVILLLFFIGSLFSDAHADVATATPQRPSATARRPALFGALGAVAFAWAGPGGAALTAVNVDAPAAIGLPQAVAGWEGPNDSENLLSGRYVGADMRAHAVYRAENARVYLDLAYYVRSRDGAELLSYVNGPFDTGRWSTLARASRRISIRGRPETVREYRVRSAVGEEYLVWSWFDVHGRIAASIPRAKILEARARLLGTQLGAAAVTVATTAENREAAIERLAEFVRAAAPGVVPGERSG